jgi:crotonobetainyl-CoA:carnitine CoA-transferase CaiB-like acyl-CoA transferase
VGNSGEALRSEVAALFKERSRAQWEAFFAEHDVCCEPVLDPSEALDHAAVRGAESRRFTIRGEGDRQWEQVRSPVLALSRYTELSEPPALGAHTSEVLGAIGLDAEAIARATR